MLKTTAFFGLALCCLSLASQGLAKASESKSRGEGRAGKAKLVKVSSSKQAGFELQSEKTKDYFNYLPFGTGQFRQDKTVLGMGLAAAQAGSLMLYFNNTSKLESSQADTHDVMKQAEATKTYDPGLISYLNQSEKFEKKAQMQAEIALLSFVGFYALGVVDAVFDPLNSRAWFTKGTLSHEKDQKSGVKVVAKDKSRDDLARTHSKPKSRNRVAPVVAPQEGKPAYGVAFARDF